MQVPSFTAVILPLTCPTVATDLLVLTNRIMSVDVSGVREALITAVSFGASVIFAFSTLTDLERCNTLKVLQATALPVFLLLAVILTLPGLTGFNLPVVQPMVATFLLEE